MDAKFASLDNIIAAHRAEFDRLDSVHVRGILDEHFRYGTSFAMDAESG